MASDLDSRVQYLKGIGPHRAGLLSKIGINTFEDVFYNLPRKYQDRSRIVSIDKLELGKESVIFAEILSVGGRRGFKKGLDILEISAGDETGRVFAVWFNQPYLRHSFKVGEKIIMFGKPELFRDRIQMSCPEFEVTDDLQKDSLDINRIVPIYSVTQGISQKVYRKIVKAALEKSMPSLKEILPFDIRSRHNLLNIAKSILNIHFPESEESRLKAYERLSFEEFFIYQIPLILRKLKRREKKGIVFDIDNSFIEEFIKSLPFDLTGSQIKVMQEIKSDMEKPFVMQRLLQGDVGSGKTIVALIASLAAVSGGYQAAFMAPTEILAEQHFSKISELIADTGRHVDKSTGRQEKIKVGLLTGSLKENDREKTLKAIARGEIDIVVGTHALLQGDVIFRKLGLIVVDEQHKFGVSQRALLSKKALNPDILIMTATPIPRTLSMTLYGDLDISVITEMPKGRKKITTKAFAMENKNDAYEFVRSQVKSGRQAFVVCPLIEDNPKLELSSTNAIYKEFKTLIFRDLKVGLIHGKLNRKKQDEVMRKFRKNEFDILVATTILEVGIDIPNASVMLIQNAERFGLSQLHQMRGRIGRGEHESFCLLLTDLKTEEAQARVKAFVSNSDGFAIAEEDLKLRGPGEFFGERQHGLAELKIADPLKQFHLLKSAREEAFKLLEADPKLTNRQNEEIRKQLYKRFPEFERFLNVA